MPTVGFDGTITEAQWSAMQLRAAEIAYRHGVWSGGVVTPGTGRAVNVAAVDAWIAGIWHTTTAPTSVAITANAGTNRRIDYIVAEADWTANTVTLKAVAGVAAATPTAPALTQNAGVLWQMPLARVTVAGNATTIAATDVASAAVQRLQFVPYEGTINIETLRGSATSWNTLSTVAIPDQGRPFRVQVSATVRFNRSEATAYVIIRAIDVDTGAVLGQGLTSNLQGGKSPAVLSSRLSEVLTGARRVRLEMLPVEASAGEVLQVLSHGANHFTVLPLPA